MKSCLNVNKPWDGIPCILESKRKLCKEDPEPWKQLWVQVKSHLLKRARQLGLLKELVCMIQSHEVITQGKSHVSAAGQDGAPATEKRRQECERQMWWCLGPTLTASPYTDKDRAGYTYILRNTCTHLTEKKIWEQEGGAVAKRGHKVKLLKNTGRINETWRLEWEATCRICVSK